VLDAKGGENKGQSDKWISYRLRDFENSRIKLLVYQNSFSVSLVKSWLLVGRSIDYGKKGSRIKLLVYQNSFSVSLVKSWLLVGRSIDYGKRGVFEILNQFLLE
jgi:hypothetical protein